jgi:hypothetical protein
LLNRNIFVDERIHQEELEKIFARVWLFIGHEPLIPNDFFPTYMGVGHDRKDSRVPRNLRLQELCRRDRLTRLLHTLAGVHER